MGKVKYTEEQKRKLLQEVKEGRSIVEAAEKYGVVLGTAYGWVGRNNNTWVERKKIVLTDQEKEIVELKKQLKKAERERDILKEAALIFGKK
jgi:transposase